MTEDGVERVKSLIASILEPRLLAQGITVTTLQDDLDLRGEGIVDSLGFVQLLAELETRLGGRIDLLDLDPEYLTNVGALSRHIAGKRVSS
jgi:acyl carrier protein